MALGNSIMFTTSGIYHVASLGLNPFELVLMGTILELTVLIFEGITGVVADTYSRKASVIIGMFILGAGFAVEGSILWLHGLVSVISVFAWVVISQLLFGIGWTFVSGANTAWMVDEAGEERAGTILMKSQRMSLVASLMGIACSVGLSTASPNLTFLAGGFLYAALGVALVFWMKETKFMRKEHALQESHFKRMLGTWLEGAGVVRRQPLLLAMVAVTLLGGAASEGYDRLWQSLLIHRHRIAGSACVAGRLVRHRVCGGNAARIGRGSPGREKNGHGKPAHGIGRDVLVHLDPRSGDPVSGSRNEFRLGAPIGARR